MGNSNTSCARDPIGLILKTNQIDQARLDCPWFLPETDRQKNMPHKILIVGDSGRGKSTFAKKLSEKINIPVYSTDDFYWKTKFTERNTREDSLAAINFVYKKDSWIVEGGTRHLIKDALALADIIYVLEFKNILQQYASIIKRFFGRQHERPQDLFDLLKHVTYKKYKQGYGNHVPPLKTLLEPYTDKTVYLKSFKEINKTLESLS